jgi:lipoyl(octanoyl) transferase
VRGLEQVMLGALSEAGVPAQTIEVLTGVWTAGDPPPTLSSNPDRKIGSIGLHVSRGVTTHGLAINVDNDLQPFEWIVPCGIEGVAMTSVGSEHGRQGDLNLFSGILIRHYEQVLR